jgi:hypothetical protein
MGGEETIRPPNQCQYFRASYPPLTAGYSSTLPPLTAGYSCTLPPLTAAYSSTLPPLTAGYSCTLPPLTAGYSSTLPPLTAGYSCTLPPLTAGYSSTLPPLTAGYSSTLPYQIHIRYQHGSFFNHPQRPNPEKNITWCMGPYNLTLCLLQHNYQRQPYDKVDLITQSGTLDLTSKASIDWYFYIYPS